MLKYMEDNSDKQNKFIKMLCDDIHISQKTLGTKYGRMCISSRQTSQGTQRIYTVNTTPLDRRRQDSDSDSDDDCQKAAPLSRQRAAVSNLAIDTNNYEVSNDCMEDSPYLTRAATTVMRSISYISSSGSEKSESEAEESEAEASEAEASEAEDSLTISP